MKTLVPFNAWQVINDDVMGGISTSSFCVGPDAAIFSGELSLANNGGFASVRSAPFRSGLRGSEAFEIHVRGDGHRYQFTARHRMDTGAPVYHCPFVTRPGTWEEYRLPFGQFQPRYRGREVMDAPPLASSEILAVGCLISDRQAGRFQLEIAWIKHGTCLNSVYPT